MRFKEGDEVRVVKGPDEYGWVPSMYRFVNKIVTIEKVSDENYYHGTIAYHIVEDGFKWNFSEKYLKPVNCKGYFDEDLFNV